MAANIKAGLSLASVGRRAMERARVGAKDQKLPVRRAVHASAYDKNIDEEVRPVVVPDDVLHHHSDKYWGPNPKTGIFGPADQHGLHTSASSASGGSVLDQTAWFRHLEEVDKSSFA